jgi:hypothetical protein
MHILDSDKFALWSTRTKTNTWYTEISHIYYLNQIKSEHGKGPNVINTQKTTRGNEGTLICNVSSGILPPHGHIPTHDCLTKWERLGFPYEFHWRSIHTIDVPTQTRRIDHRD